MAAVCAALVAPATAQTLRWAAQNDVLTLDPHSQNHATTNAILMHAYEGLTRYGPTYQVEPALATLSQIGIGAVRWRQVLLGLDIKVSFRTVLSVTYIASFFNAWLLGTMGGDIFTQSLRCMAVESRICPIGFAGGTIPQIPANLLLIKTIAVTGFNYGYYVGWSPLDARFEEADRTFALMERIRGWCEAGLCRPHVDRTFSLDQAAEAMRALLERSVTGRVAIVM